MNADGNEAQVLSAYICVICGLGSLPTRTDVSQHLRGGASRLVAEGDGGGHRGGAGLPRISGRVGGDFREASGRSAGGPKGSPGGAEWISGRRRRDFGEGPRGFTGGSGRSPGGSGGIYGRPPGDLREGPGGFTGGLRRIYGRLWRISGKPQRDMREALGGFTGGSPEICGRLWRFSGRLWRYSGKGKASAISKIALLVDGKGGLPVSERHVRAVFHLNRSASSTARVWMYRGGEDRP